MRKTGGAGNGDLCPVAREHGQMLVLQSGRQYCPHVEHAGRPKTHPRGASSATRCFWPGGWKTFADEVTRYNEATSGEAAKALPDIDMEAFNA